MVCLDVFSECNSTSPLPCRGWSFWLRLGFLLLYLIMKKKIIKILSIISCVVIIAVFLFAFPASAAVGDVVFSTRSMDDIFEKDVAWGSDSFDFTEITSDMAASSVYTSGTAIVSKLNSTSMFLGGKLKFPLLDNGKFYDFRLPLCFSNMLYDLKPRNVTINLYNSDGRVIAQQTKSYSQNSSIPGYVLRNFTFKFSMSGELLNQCSFIDFFIQVDNFDAVNSYLYFGIFKSDICTIKESISSETQAIINNQNENTDKILNGGTDNPHYEKPDSSAAQQQDQLTQDIESSTSEGVESANNLFSSFNGLLGGGSHIANGLMAVTAFMNEFLGVPWLSGIITFGLTLGIFSFLLGMGFFISGFARGVKSGEYSLNKEKRAAYRESQRAARSRRY